MPNSAYDKLRHHICVELGFCGSLKDGAPLHVDDLIPLEGVITAEQFAELTRANAVVSEVVRAINQESPPEDQEALYVWHPAKWERVTTKYKALFPEGKLLKKFWAYTTFSAIGMLCLLVSLASGGH